MKKLFSKLAVCLLAAAIALPAVMVGGGTLKAEAAVKRTAVVTSLLTNKGKINVADWSVVGNKDNIEISNNGKVFKVSGAAWPGYRICPYATVPANTGYYVEMDVVKTNPATAKMNLSGYVTNYGNGASSNIYLSALGIEAGSGTNYGDNGDKKAVWNGVNSTLNEGLRYRFWFRINPDDPSYGDFIIYTKPLGDETAEYTEGCVLLKVCSITEESHYAHVYIEGDATIDNFAFTKEDGTPVFETDFSDESIFDSTGVATEGKIYKSGGNIVNDSYLKLNTTEKLVSALRVVKGDGVENVMELETSMKVASTAGKAGIVLGMDDESADFGAAGASTLSLENVTDAEGKVTTKMKLINGETVSGEITVGNLSDDFHSLKISGKSDGKLVVYIDGKEAAVYENADMEGYVGLMTDGTNGAEVSFNPEFIVNAYKGEVGTGKDLENNFNTGYINPENYTNDTHNAVSLGNNANGIVAKDGILKFDGTSDGAHFAINGVYADFILQFDWITYAWADRPTDNGGKVNYKDKPESGIATELYSPLGIAFGKKEATGGWTDAKLLRFFDTYNLIQFINNDETGLAYNECMGTGIGSAEQVTQIREGKIKFYEETVNIKIVALNGVLQVYGVVMKDGTPEGEHKLLATYTYENCTGYISISTSEAGYFGIDNLRVTKIDGWSSEQIAAYDNFKTIADEVKPEAIATPVLTLSDKTVTWNAVDGATGYIVAVNGVVGDKITDTEYTLDKTAAGSYVITVKAVGDGEAKLDSEESSPVTIVVKGEESVGQPGESETDSSSAADSSVGSSDATSSSGCFGSVSMSSVFALFAVVGVAMLKKKKD